MKYSSTTSLGLSGDRLSIRVLSAPRLFQRAQHFDAAQHNAFVDLVGVEGDADCPQEHDRQPAAEVLAEFVEAAQNRRLIAGAVAELRRVDGQTQPAEQTDHPPPVLFREESR